MGADWLVGWVIGCLFVGMSACLSAVPFIPSFIQHLSINQSITTQAITHYRPLFPSSSSNPEPPVLYLVGTSDADYISIGRYVSASLCVCVCVLRGTAVGGRMLSIENMHHLYLPSLSTVLRPFVLWTHKYTSNRGFMINEEAHMANIPKPIIYLVKMAGSAASAPRGTSAGVCMLFDEG